MSNSAIVYKNIYKILMYATDEMRNLQLLNIGEERFTALDELYTKILTTSMHQVLESGLLQRYTQFKETTSRPKGKINPAESIRRGVDKSGLMSCSYFKLDIDNPTNRIIKLAITILISNIASSEEKKSKINTIGLRLIIDTLHNVSDISINEVDSSDIDTSEFSIEYKTAYHISKIIIDEFITKEDGTDKRLIETEDENRMNKVFEKFVQAYYKIHFASKTLKVGRTDLGVSKTAGKVFPKSETDVTIENKSLCKSIIIDTKWYGEILKTNKYGAKKLHATNYYQIKSYVEDYIEEYPGKYGKTLNSITGVLLYAKSDIEIDIGVVEKDEVDVRKIGKVTVRIIDLSLEFSDIESKLNGIVSELVV